MASAPVRALAHQDQHAEAELAQALLQSAARNSSGGGAPHALGQRAAGRGDLGLALVRHDGLATLGLGGAPLSDIRSHDASLRVRERDGQNSKDGKGISRLGSEGLQRVTR